MRYFCIVKQHRCATIISVKSKNLKTVALERSLHTELKVLAAKRQMELGDLVSIIVREYLAKQHDAEKVQR